MSHLANRVALHMQLSQFKAQNNLKNVFFTVKNYNHGLINNKIDIIVGGRLLSSMLYFNKRPDNDFINFAVKPRPLGRGCKATSG